jgi:hypothetical protein
MKYNLAAMSRRAGNRRKAITFAPISITKAQQSSLAKINRAILAPWLGARERITEAYARELARVLATDSIDDLAGLFADLAAQVERLVLELTPAMRDWAFRVEQVHRGKWARTVLAGADVEVGYLIGPNDAQESIGQFLARNTALVKDTATQAQGRISDAVFRGLQARKPAREVGREIADALGMARRRADRIAADQAVKLSAALDAQRQREAGLTVWRWNHSGKLHPREWHRDRDGNLYADDKADQGKLANGDVVAEPPEPDDQPGVPPFCGCVRQGVLVFEGAVL